MSENHKNQWKSSFFRLPLFIGFSIKKNKKIKNSEYSKYFYAIHDLPRGTTEKELGKKLQPSLRKKSCNFLTIYWSLRQKPKNILWNPYRNHWFSLIFHENTLRADGPSSATTWSWEANSICAHNSVSRRFWNCGRKNHTVSGRLRKIRMKWIYFRDFRSRGMLYTLL